MAPRKRRRSTGRAPGLRGGASPRGRGANSAPGLPPALRLALVLGANLAALAVLWHLLFSERAPQVEAASALARFEPTAQAQAVDPWLAGSEGEALERDLARIVGRAIEQARQLTKNRVHVDNVDVAVHVRELGVGAARRAGAEIGFKQHHSLRPASNMKLVTTAAALVLLGPDWHFETPFEAVGALDGGVLAGDRVYDPAAEGEVPGALRDTIARMGLGVIRGDVILDERDFIVPGPGPEWPDPGQHWAEYCALSGGFSATRGALFVRVTPRSVGASADVSVRPAAHGLPQSLGVRTTKGGATTVAMHARSSGVLVRGTIPAGGRSFSDEMAHPDPVELFGSVLAGALSDAGVLLEGRVRRKRHAAAGRLLGTLRSPWLPLLRPINTDSNNAAADQLFLATGHAVMGAGSREASAAATAEALDRLGVSAEGLVQVDGSGLSRANRVTAAQMTALIAAVLSADTGGAEAFVQSLALAGETGTLDDRMKGGLARGRVRAKTGFISGTSALSGVAHSVGGRSFVFSILVNYPNAGGLNSSCWKPMQDELCERLVATR